MIDLVKVWRFLDRWTQNYGPPGYDPFYHPPPSRYVLQGNDRDIVVWTRNVEPSR